MHGWLCLCEVSFNSSKFCQERKKKFFSRTGDSDKKYYCFETDSTSVSACSYVQPTCTGMKRCVSDFIN